MQDILQPCPPTHMYPTYLYYIYTPFSCFPVFMTLNPNSYFKAFSLSLSRKGITAWLHSDWSLCLKSTRILKFVQSKFKSKLMNPQNDFLQCTVM